MKVFTISNAASVTVKQAEIADICLPDLLSEDRSLMSCAPGVDCEIVSSSSIHVCRYISEKRRAQIALAGVGKTCRECCPFLRLGCNLERARKGSA